jgi:sugar phosphate permease
MRSGERAVAWTLWLTYGSFYFCRTNISAAVPGIQEEFGYSKTEIGLVLGALKLAYGVGQLINGQLAERASARWLLAFGMFGSAGLNLVFGFGEALYFLLFVWAANGYSQALGWPPCMRVAANWFPVERRGRAIGIIGTGYQALAAVTFVVAGWSAEHFGWRGAFYVPAGLLVLIGIFMLVSLRESPGAAASPELRTRVSPIKSNLLVTLTNPGLWLLAGSLGLLNACRYGFVDWGLTHLKETQGIGVGKAALNYAILPLGGILGAYGAGWMSDRWFGGRRGPMISILLASLGVVTLFYDGVARASPPATVGVLMVVGFLIYGPQVLLVGTAPADLARRGTAAAAAGFVNFVGYMGAYSGDLLTGRLVDSHGWRTAVVAWAGCAFAAALFCAPLWNATAEGPESSVPRTAAETA